MGTRNTGTVDNTDLPPATESVQSPKAASSAPTETLNGDDEDDTLSYFSKLAQEE